MNAGGEPRLAIKYKIKREMGRYERDAGKGRSNGRGRDAEMGEREKQVNSQGRMKVKGRRRKKEGKKERKAKERKERKKRKGRKEARPWLGRRRRRRPEMAGNGRRWPAKTPSPSQRGCKCSSFENFGVLEMVFRRTKLYLVGKSTPRRRGWRGWWWLRWCRWW